MPSEQRTYTVGDGPVVLEATVGEGQFGTTVVLIDDRFIQPAEQRNGYARFELGAGAALRGKTADVVTTVNATNPSTMRTCVTHRLSGGPAPLEWEMEEEAAGTGASVDYEVALTFA